MSFFRKLDIFGSNITLNYNKDNIFRTSFGGVVTIICIVALVVLFFNNILTLIEKSKNRILFITRINSLFGIFSQSLSFAFKGQVTFFSTVNYDPDPDVFEVGFNEMMIGVKFDQANFIERPKMNVTFERRHYTKYQNGTSVQEKIPVELEPCTLDHFLDLPNYNINWTERYQLSNVSDYLCLKKGETFQIGGKYESKEFYHLKFTLKKCQNYTNPLKSWNPVCDTPENIATTSEDARILFLFSNTLFNPDSPSVPISTFLDTLVFNVQPQRMYTTANVMLTEQTMRTDESITVLKNIQEQNFVSFQQGDYKQQFSVGNYTNYSEIFFLRSNFSTVVKRTFLKIDQVISYMGGFCQIFLLISAVIVSQFNEYIYNIELANKLYDFDIQNKSNNNRKSEPKSQQLSSLNQLEPIKMHSYQIQMKKDNNNDEKMSQHHSSSPINPVNTQLKQEITEDQIAKNPNINQEKIQKINGDNITYNNSIFQEGQKEETYQHIEGNMTSQRLDTIRPFYNNINSKKMLISQNNLLPNELSFENTKKTLQTSLQNDGYVQTQNDKILQMEPMTKQIKTEDTNDLKNTKEQSNQNQTANQIGRTHFSQQPYTAGVNVKQNTLSAVNKFNANAFGTLSQCNIQGKPQDIDINLTFTHNSFRKIKTEKVGINNKQFLEQELKYIIERDRTISLNVKYFINKLSCGKFYNTPEVQLLNKAIDMVKQDLDIFMILERQKEIEKFKKLFLNMDQQVLFNFFPKPLIQIEKEQTLLIDRESLKKQDSGHKPGTLMINKKQTKKLNISLKNLSILSKVVKRFKDNISDSKELTDYQKLFNCYENLIVKNNSEIQKEVNNKLIQQLGNEMKSIFEVAHRMKLKQLGAYSNQDLMNKQGISQKKIEIPSTFKSRFNQEKTNNIQNAEEYVQDHSRSSNSNAHTQENNCGDSSNQQKHGRIDVNDISLDQNLQQNKVISKQENKENTILNLNKAAETVVVVALPEDECQSNKLILFEEEQYEFQMKAQKQQKIINQLNQ